MKAREDDAWLTPFVNRVCENKRVASTARWMEGL